MEGKITRDGALQIKRSNVLKAQHCPFTIGEGGLDCGDWCPHFSEPREVRDDEFDRITETGRVTGNTVVTAIDICHNKTLYFESLTDERK